MKHKCPVTNCTAQVDCSKLMCPGHWSLVPKSLGDSLYSAHRSAPRSRLHFAAMTACIDAVNQFLSANTEPNHLQPKLL